MSSRLVNVLLSTSTFTTVFPTTYTVTSSSAIAGCTIAQSAQITCSDGYYNTYGSQWQEFCAASVSGGTARNVGTALSLRACMSACAVNAQCTAVFWNSSDQMCYLVTGDPTITSGGSYQAASRLSTDASPCASTWVVTETGAVTSTGEVVYTITTTSTPSASTLPIPSSTPVSRSSIPVLPSSIPFSSFSIPVSLPSTPPGSGTAIAHTSVTQNANPQHTTTQTAGAPTQETQTCAYASSMTTSTVYLTEVDVITACPPSVHNCPFGQSSTYTTTRTVATQTTTYLVAVTDFAQASVSMNTSGQPMISQSTDVSVQPAAVPTLSLAQPIDPSHDQTDDHTLSAKPQGSAPSSSARKSGFASSGSSQATADVIMMNSVLGESTSATTSASGAVYTGEAPKMGPFSTLFTVLNMLLAVLFF